MSIADGMHHIVEDIAQSRNERIAGIINLNREVGEVRSVAQRTIKSFNSERKQNTTAMRRSLRRSRKALGRESVAMLGGFHTTRMAMARETEATLEDFTAGMRKDVNDIRIDATNMVHGFAEERVTRGIELTSLLKSYTDGIIQDVQYLMGENQKQRRAVQDDLSEAHEIWQNQAQQVKPRVQATPKPERKMAGIASISGVEGDPHLKEKVLKVIRSSPKGISLPNAGKKIGVEWRRLVRPAKELLKEGEVRKRDTHYFPG